MIIIKSKNIIKINTRLIYSFWLSLNVKTSPVFEPNPKTGSNGWHAQAELDGIFLNVCKTCPSWSVAIGDESSGEKMRIG